MRTKQIYEADKFGDVRMKTNDWILWNVLYDTNERMYVEVN